MKIMPSIQLPTLLALSGADATVKVESVHATGLTSTKEPAVELMKWTTFMIMRSKAPNTTNQHIAKFFPPMPLKATHTTDPYIAKFSPPMPLKAAHTTNPYVAKSFPPMPSAWSLFRITGVVKTFFPANTPSSHQQPIMINLIVPIIAILFVQLMASEMQAQATKHFGTQILPKGFAQRALIPIDTSVTNNANADTSFSGSIDSGFAEIEGKHKSPFSYERDDMVPEAVDLVPDHCETQDDTAHQELLKQLVLGVLQYVNTAVSQEMKSLQPSLDVYLEPHEDYEEYEEDEQYEEYENYEEYDGQDEHHDRSQLFLEVLQYLDTAVSDELKALQPRLNDYLRSEEYGDNGDDEEHDQANIGRQASTISW